MMTHTTTEIPREGWNRFFARFSQDHELQLVAVEVLGGEIGAQVEGRSLLLGGISAGDDTASSLVMMFDSIDGERLTHMVNAPTHVWLQRGRDNTDEALEVESSDGTKTLVKFQSEQSRPAGNSGSADTRRM
jgi:hypothetical protein